MALQQVLYLSISAFYLGKGPSYGLKTRGLSFPIFPSLLDAYFRNYTTQNEPRCPRICCYHRSIFPYSKLPVVPHISKEKLIKGCSSFLCTITTLQRFSMRAELQGTFQKPTQIHRTAPGADDKINPGCKRDDMHSQYILVLRSALAWSQLCDRLPQPRTLKSRSAAQDVVVRTKSIRGPPFEQSDASPPFTRRGISI
jgi:hypothetical protein